MGQVRVPFDGNGMGWDGLRGFVGDVEARCVDRERWRCVVVWDSFVVVEGVGVDEKEE